jgi:hypothetical protein
MNQTTPSSNIGKLTELVNTYLCIATFWVYIALFYAELKAHGFSRGMIKTIENQENFL